MSTKQRSADSINGSDAGPSREKLLRKARIPEDMKALLLEQAHVEMSASLAYTGMTFYFDREGMEGFATYFKKQSDEERGHCMQFLEFLSKRGGTSRITPSMLTEPRTDYDSPLHAMECYLAHERAVADSINTKYEQAMNAKDWPTATFLQPFITYQVDEEDTADKMMEEVYKLTKGRDMTQVLDTALQAGVGGD